MHRTGDECSSFHRRGPLFSVKTHRVKMIFWEWSALLHIVTMALEEKTFFSLLLPCKPTNKNVSGIILEMEAYL